MPIFTPTGEQDPLLHVSLRRGESLYCESGAMVMMEANLELRGKMQGGLLSALARRFTNDESIFQQHIVAERGDGDCLLAPIAPGALEVLDVGAVQYRLNDGAYLAATEHVDIKAKMQSLGGALLGQTGGFFIGESSGSGQLVINGLGTLFHLEVQPDRPVIIDNGHVVAWDARLNYDISLRTGQGGGLLGNVLNSVTGGEGVVLKFSGQGRVILSSRSASAFRGWLRSQ